MTVIHRGNGNGWLFLSTPLFIVISHGICYCIVRKSVCRADRGNDFSNTFQAGGIVEEM